MDYIDVVTEKCKSFYEWTKTTFNDLNIETISSSVNAPPSLFGKISWSILLSS